MPSTTESLTGEEPGAKLLQSGRERKAAKTACATKVEVSPVIYSQNLSGPSQAQFATLLDFSHSRIDDRQAMQALGIGSDEDLFLLMAQAQLPMPRLPESSTRCMVDDLSAMRN